MSVGQEPLDSECVPGPSSAFYTTRMAVDGPSRPDSGITVGRRVTWREEPQEYNDEGQGDNELVQQLTDVGHGEIEHEWSKSKIIS